MTGQPLKIYLAGPIANTTDFTERFKAAREEVRGLGYIPVCPIELNGVDENSRKEDAENRRMYLINDIRALLECDGIYLLEGWWDSRGARMEHVIASTLDLLVLYQDKADRLAAGFGAGPRTFERMYREKDNNDSEQSNEGSSEGASSGEPTNTNSSVSGDGQGGSVRRVGRPEDATDRPSD